MQYSKYCKKIQFKNDAQNLYNSKMKQYTWKNKINKSEELKLFYFFENEGTNMNISKSFNYN